MAVVVGGAVKRESWAEIDGPYRYALGRVWGNRAARVCWVMLNPSTADADNDDPTIRRCMALSGAWGFGALVVVNLFAFRSTNPRGLRLANDPVGPRNDAVIAREVQSARQTIVAWGVKGALRGRDREVLGFLSGSVFHLGLTRDGHPRHPLYVPANVVPGRWDERAR
jgi:hypothetical protein